ncbi:MAG TPA: hypothetical protein VGG99_23465 [Acetobacteraceae bacterium]
MPISTWAEVQSIAQGFISTATPASPTPAASHRRSGMCSFRKISDSGTTQMVVVLARMAVRPAGTQVSASCAKAK